MWIATLSAGLFLVVKGLSAEYSDTNLMCQNTLCR